MNRFGIVREVRDKFKLRLRGKTCVFIDWANVYGWKDELKGVVDPKKLFDYLRTYREIKQIRFYFGRDKNKRSTRFLNDINRNRLGREVWVIGKGLFKVELPRLGDLVDKKNVPRSKDRGRD